MAQEKVWDKEYQNPLLVTKHDKPQADVLRFFKYLKKEQQIKLSGLNILDLGSGTGRNSNYMAQKGATVTGLEIAPTAIELAEKRAKELGVKPKYIKQSMGQTWPLEGESINLALDVLSSNSLFDSERKTYLKELKRVLKPGSFLLVKTLTMEGDKNTRNLLREFPGPEKDTYVLPELGLVERVFSESDFRNIYSDFEVLRLEKKKSKVPFSGQVFNRRFIVAYLKLK